MKKKKTKIAIGIPAYNEEANIDRLISSLISQDQEAVEIGQIVVVSDASEDKTDEKVRGFEESFVKLVRNKKRLGISETQNKITNMVNEEILVLMDADVLPANSRFLDEICKYITQDQADLVGADMIPSLAGNFFENVLNDTHLMKRQIFRKFKKGNNIYNCPGRARAFSKRLYKKIKFDSNFCEDTYSYLFCITQNYSFRFAPKAKVYFRHPNNLADHLRQSKRFVHDKSNMKKAFPEKIVDEEFKLPKEKILGPLVDYLFNQPVSAFTYLLVFLYSRFFSFKKYSLDHARIDPPASTKSLIKS